MGSLHEEIGGNELFPSPPYPAVIQLTQLENQLRDKEREMGEARSEIKALKVTESLKDKALLELSDELKKMDEKLRTAEKHIESKNLEIKKLSNDKKAALSAQFAAEAALRRVHATKEDEEFFPVEAVIAPLESDIKMYKNKISKLQEDKKALERVTKSKEEALIEADKILRSALERVLIVEDIHSQNLDLRRQIEICQDENKFLNKIYRQKVVEVEKLSQTIHELEEAVIAGGAAGNAVRDYQRQVSALNEEKRTLERELARVRVSVSRVAKVAANEWKDGNDRVIPVKQWLEERRCFQGETQRLQDKLALAERAAKTEAQFKDKLRFRLKTLEESLMEGLEFSSDNKGPRVQFTTHPRTSLSANKACTLKQTNSTSETAKSTRYIKETNMSMKKYNAGEISARKNLLVPGSKCYEVNVKENTELDVNPGGHVDYTNPKKTEAVGEVRRNLCCDGESQINGSFADDQQDMVSGFLYDTLQKEVTRLRKSVEEKIGLLNEREDEIKTLQRKVDVLTKAMEVESRKMRREAIAREKAALLVKSEADKQKGRSTNTSKRSVRHLKSSPSSQI